jgi:hypothetical protein
MYEPESVVDGGIAIKDPKYITRLRLVCQANDS